MFAILYNCGGYSKLAHVDETLHLFDTERDAKWFIRRHSFYGKLPRRINGYNESVRVVRFNPNHQRDTE